MAGLARRARSEGKTTEGMPSNLSCFQFVEEEEEASLQSEGEEKLRTLSVTRNSLTGRRSPFRGALVEHTRLVRRLMKS